MGHSIKKFCPALWLSGFFALGGLVHLARFIFGVELSVSGHEIPLSLSGIGGAVLAGLSAIFYFISQKRPCESHPDSHSAGGCCVKK